MNLILSLLSLTLSIKAGTISFIGPCDKKPLFTTELKNIEGESVGYITIKTLKAYSIPFKGTEQSLSSIFNTPIGLDAMEILSDTEMLAHGWCYSVNGFEPGTYPNEIILKKNDHILWWFGHAHYNQGKWITQCTPSYQRRSAQICDN